MNTHRRDMRAVTPVGRIGRNAAGAAIAAGILVGGAGAANAGGEAAADAHANVASNDAPAAHVAPVAKDDVTIPVLAQGTTDAGLSSVAAAAPSVKIATPEPAVTEKTTSDDESTDDSTSEDTSDDTTSKNRDKSDRSTDSSSSSSSDDESTSDDEESDSASSGSLISTARSGIGVPYVWAGSSRSGWDCSGFTSWVYARNGISIPHSAAGQRDMGTVISRSEARPGDLVYTPGHVGIYAGNGRIIDAGHSGGTTSERDMWPASWTFVRIG